MVTPSGGWLLPMRWRMPCSSGAKYDPSKNEVSALRFWLLWRDVRDVRGAGVDFEFSDAATRGLLFAAGGAGMSCTRWPRDCMAVVEPSRAGIFCSLLSSNVLYASPTPYPCLKKYGPFRLLNIEPACRAHGMFWGRVYPDPDRQIGSFSCLRYQSNTLPCNVVSLCRHRCFNSMFSMIAEIHRVHPRSLPLFSPSPGRDGLLYGRSQRRAVPVEWWLIGLPQEDSQPCKG